LYSLRLKYSTLNIKEVAVTKVTFLKIHSCDGNLHYIRPFSAASVTFLRLLNNFFKLFVELLKFNKIKIFTNVTEATLAGLVRK